MSLGIRIVQYGLEKANLRRRAGASIHRPRAHQPPRERSASGLRAGTRTARAVPRRRGHGRLNILSQMQRINRRRRISSALEWLMGQFETPIWASRVALDSMTAGTPTDIST